MIAFYFKFVSFLLGAALTLGGSLYLARPEKFKAWIIKQVLPPQKPFWLIPAGIFFLLWTILTWWLYARLKQPETLFLSFLVSLSVLKSVLFVVRYAKYRGLVMVLIEEKGAVLKSIARSEAVIGISLIGMAFLRL